MRQTLISYKAKPERADENQELIEAVFSELQAKAPKDLRYLALRLGDGSFVHLVMDGTADGTSAISGLQTFQAFQSGLKDRYAEPLQAREASIVGNYRMLAE
jgi:hypothetical protein